MNIQNLQKKESLSRNDQFTAQTLAQVFTAKPTAPVTGPKANRVAFSASE